MYRILFNKHHRTGDKCESNLPLVRIAEECGFSSQSALTTSMRRYLGLTPKRLRSE